MKYLPSPGAIVNQFAVRPSLPLPLLTNESPNGGGGVGWVGLDSSGFRATDPGRDGSSASGATINEVLDTVWVREHTSKFDQERRNHRSNVSTLRLGRPLHRTWTITLYRAWSNSFFWGPAPRRMHGALLPTGVAGPGPCMQAPPAPPPPSFER